MSLASCTLFVKTLSQWKQGASWKQCPCQRNGILQLLLSLNTRWRCKFSDQLTRPRGVHLQKTGQFSSGQTVCKTKIEETNIYMHETWHVIIALQRAVKSSCTACELYLFSPAACWNKTCQKWDMVICCHEVFKISPSRHAWFQVLTLGMHDFWDFGEGM